MKSAKRHPFLAYVLLYIALIAMVGAFRACESLLPNTPSGEPDPYGSECQQEYRGVDC